MLEPRGHEYANPTLSVRPFPGALTPLFPAPRGIIDRDWPPTQLVYLGEYLKQLSCSTIVVESHYIDRDWIDDLSLFYSRSLRSYSNACQRLHFFRTAFTAEQWIGWTAEAASKFEEVETRLQEGYLGFSVIRPLSATPIGRTVVPTLGQQTASGAQRTFGSIRPYVSHLAGFTLRVDGLAFQQQDQGVSACATTALWCALHRVAYAEEMSVPTPAAITEAASRYFLAEGRTLPADGLSMIQMCEAARAFGLAPLFVRGRGPELDRAYLQAYTDSGFPPVLGIARLSGDGSGHALTCVGLKRGALPPRTDEKVGFRDEASNLLGVYVHDDRLGPYAIGTLATETTDKGLRTRLSLAWPDEKAPADDSVVLAMMIPVPLKLRLTLDRLRQLAMSVAQATSQAIPRAAGRVVFCARYEKGTKYQRRAYEFGLTTPGLRAITVETMLSRYLGLVEIRIDDAPLFDLVVDATESHANPATVAVVRRGTLSDDEELFVAAIAARVNARYAR
jgi:hypothetical protein